MNTWAIIGIITLLVIIVGIAAVNAISAPEDVETIDCSTCEGSCSLEKNCGLSTCGAVNSGNCGCGR